MGNDQRNNQESNLEKGLEKTSTSSEKKIVERTDIDKLSLNGSAYEIITDHKEALDLEMLEARYSELLEKYDYIVGDISYDKLRLRGFYEDHAKKVPIDMRISSLEDYLLEYCSFGCKYFVLKRLDPKKKETMDFEPYKKRSSRKRTRKPSRKSNAKQDNRQSRNQKQPTQPKPKTSPKKDFVQKEVQADAGKVKKDEHVKTVKDQKGNTRFQIRRKKTEAKS